MQKYLEMVEINLKRANGEFGFEAKDTNGHTVTMDTSPETGGENFGFRPMQLLLVGLGGCSGIDIGTILKKQRQTVEGFSMKILGERETGKDLTLWKEVKIVFELKGTIEQEKADRACELAMQKYCSVAETLRKGGTEISWEVVINP